MAGHERLEGESTEQFIFRRAHEIHLEEAEINNPFISPEEQSFLGAKAVGLIPSEETIAEE